MDFKDFLAIIGTISGFILAWIGFHFNSKKDSKKDGIEDGIIITKLDFIQNDIKDIRSDSKNITETLKDHEKRIILVERDVAAAHNRVDKIKGTRQ